MASAYRTLPQHQAQRELARLQAADATRAPHNTGLSLGADDSVQPQPGPSVFLPPRKERFLVAVLPFPVC